MSRNCIRCVKNERTGHDLLCDDCRNEKQKSMDKPKEQQRLELTDAAKKIADAVNETAHAGIPIPFIVATLELIKHDLCNQHIAMTNQMHQIAKGKAPIPFDPTKGIPEMPNRNEVPPPSDN
jgi:hypothetical protein